MDARYPACYAPSLLPHTHVLTLRDQQQIHHLKDVLRLNSGKNICLLNGQGLWAQAKIQDISKTQITFEIISIENYSRPLPQLVLACAIPKKSKFETIVEKCTELGVDEIIPLRTTRTELSKAPEALARQQRRYEDVAINACKQSRRSFLPKVHAVTKFAQALEMISQNDLALFGALQIPGKKLPEINSDLLRSKERVFVLVGPEGDFTQEETQFALKQGAIPITLGPNVLKVETAAMAAMAFLSLKLRS